MHDMGGYGTVTPCSIGSPLATISIYTLDNNDAAGYLVTMWMNIDGKLDLPLFTFIVAIGPYKTILFPDVT